MSVAPAAISASSAPEPRLERELGGAAGQEILAQRERALARRALVVQRDTGVLCERELATVDLCLAGEHPQQRRLAGAVAPGNRQPLAPLELERDAAQQRRSGDVLGEV